MKILTHKDIVNLNLESIRCYEWVSDMIKNKKKTILPVKISIKPTEKMFYNIMPTLIPKYNGAGLKVVTRYPLRNPSLNSQIILYDYESGNIKALMDGNYITAMRTGAVAAHSIKLLAKRGFDKIGIIGLGNQARATMKVLISLFPNKKMILKLMKYKNQHLLFVDYIKKLPNAEKIEFVLCDSYKETIKESDVIISSVTYFDKDICEDQWFGKGCLVVPIHTRGFMKCDLFFDKVYADDTNHVKGFKYFDKFKNFAEISDIISGDIEGRKNDLERIIVYNIGLSIHDIYFAERIYKIAELNEVGQEVSLDSPTEKFWI